jgi:tetratricopeptide (TPR) repeat protein
MFGIRLRGLGRAAVVGALAATALASGFTAAWAGPASEILAQTGAEGRLLRVLQSYQQLEYAGAVTALDEALRLDPSWVDGYAVRGAARSRLGDYEGAIADYEEILRLDPGNPSATLNRQNALAELSR